MSYLYIQTKSNLLLRDPIDTARALMYEIVYPQLKNEFGPWQILGTDRYILDLHHELSHPTKVKGARILAQSIVNSGDTLVTQSNLGNWNDMDIIDWLEARGYTWDIDLWIWAIHVQL